MKRAQFRHSWSELRKNSSCRVQYFREMKAQLEARIKVKMGAALDWHCGNSVANIVAHICFPRFPLTYHFATLVNFQKCCVHFPQYKERTQFEMQVQVRVWFLWRCKMFFRKSSLMTPQNYWLKPFFPLQNDTPFSFSTNQKVSFWGKWQTVVTFSLNRCSMCTPSPRNFWRF